MDYLSQFSTKATPQSEPIPGSTQVPNSAGGYAWEADDWERLERFLILGAEGGTYYIGERKLVRENADVVLRTLSADGPRVVRTIFEVSHSGRAPKNEPALFALALAISHGDPVTREAAGRVLPQVARTGTHLFQFLTYVQQFRGWGRGLRRAVAAWYERDDLDYQLIKYRQREGWTHRDVLRKAHPSPSPFKARLTPINVPESLAWAAGKNDGDLAGHPLLVGFEALQRAKDPSGTRTVLARWAADGINLPREAIQPEHLNDVGVWEQLLLAGMPMTALIRNLATMTRVGLLTPFSGATKVVMDQLANPEHLHKARIHPLQVLVAQRTYASGHGDRGKHTWQPVPAITDALDDAFYASFQHLEPTGKRYLLGLDVSGSMGFNSVAGMNITPREGSVAMAMATAAKEQHMILGFSHELVPLDISPRQRLDDAIARVSGIPFGGTDAALPILAAQRQGLEVDTFVIYTDNETWAGRVHPAQALKSYRQTSGIPSKLVVVGMTSNGFSIADPNDPGMLDVVGFDTSVPRVLAEFSR